MYPQQQFPGYQPYQNVRTAQSFHPYSPHPYGAEMNNHLLAHTHPSQPQTYGNAFSHLPYPQQQQGVPIPHQQPHPAPFLYSQNQPVTSIQHPKQQPAHFAYGQQQFGPFQHTQQPFSFQQQPLSFQHQHQQSPFEYPQSQPSPFQQLEPSPFIQSPQSPGSQKMHCGYNASCINQESEQVNQPSELFTEFVSASGDAGFDDDDDEFGHFTAAEPADQPDTSIVDDHRQPDTSIVDDHKQPDTSIVDDHRQPELNQDDPFCFSNKNQSELSTSMLTNTLNLHGSDALAQSHFNSISTTAGFSSSVADVSVSDVQHRQVLHDNSVSSLPDRSITSNNIESLMDHYLTQAFHSVDEQAPPLKTVSSRNITKSPVASLNISRHQGREIPTALQELMISELDLNVNAEKAHPPLSVFPQHEEHSHHRHHTSDDFCDFASANDASVNDNDASANDNDASANNNDASANDNDASANDNDASANDNDASANDNDASANDNDAAVDDSTQWGFQESQADLIEDTVCVSPTPRADSDASFGDFQSPIASSVLTRFESPSSEQSLDDFQCAEDDTNVTDVIPFGEFQSPVQAKMDNSDDLSPLDSPIDMFESNKHHRKMGSDDFNNDEEISKQFGFDQQPIHTNQNTDKVQHETSQPEIDSCFLRGRMSSLDSVASDHSGRRIIKPIKIIEPASLSQSSPIESIYEAVQMLLREERLPEAMACRKYIESLSLIEQARHLYRNSRQIAAQSDDETMFEEAIQQRNHMRALSQSLPSEEIISQWKQPGFVPSGHMTWEQMKKSIHDISVIDEPTYISRFPHSFIPSSELLIEETLKYRREAYLFFKSCVGPLCDEDRHIKLFSTMLGVILSILETSSSLSSELVGIASYKDSPEHVGVITTYYKGIIEVRRVSYRIKLAYDEFQLQNSDVFEQIQRCDTIWQALLTLFMQHQTQIPYLSNIISHMKKPCEEYASMCTMCHSHAVLGHSKRCMLCLLPSVLVENPLLIHDGTPYHASCVNMWLNGVSSNPEWMS